MPFWKGYHVRMTLILVAIFGLIILSLVIWGVQAFLPFPPVPKNLLCFLAILLYVIWLVDHMGWFRIAARS